MKIEIIQTDDGSSTLYLPLIDETYHSKFGAIQEARHVFINNGLAKIDKPVINLLEIGFGTGLNALLSTIYSTENNIKINYNTIEKYPLGNEITNRLNYTDQIQETKELFIKLHESPWEKTIELNAFFSLKKIQADILVCNLPNEIDLIYFDAFAPSKQAELWSGDIFEKLNKTLNNNGLLVTYSSAGIVKKALRAAGFTVKRLPGPPGKHHMLVAIK